MNFLNGSIVDFDVSGEFLTSGVAAFQSNAFQIHEPAFQTQIVETAGFINGIFDVVGGGLLASPGIGTVNASFTIAAQKFNAPARLDIGSSITAGRFTDKGWQPIRPAAIKWNRRRHNAFIQSIRDEERRKAEEDRQLSAMAKAERELERAQEDHDSRVVALNNSVTRTNHAKATEAKERLDTARAKVNEAHSIEYIEKLWANYNARKRGRN